jgi:hypothetical protein
MAKYKKPHRSDCITCYIVIDLKRETTFLHYNNSSDFKRKISIKSHLKKESQFRIILGSFKENSPLMKKYKALVRSQSRANIKDRFVVEYYQDGQRVARVPLKTMRAVSGHLGLGRTQAAKYLNKPYIKDGVTILIRKVML